VRYSRDTALIAIFGKRVRDLRTSRGYSQEHFANLCDVEASQISRIELGKINTSITQAQKIAQAFDMPLKELFDFSYTNVHDAKL
jgi:transcriptional regulator with XRE-family HTH domain